MRFPILAAAAVAAVLCTAAPASAAPPLKAVAKPLAVMSDGQKATGLLVEPYRRKPGDTRLTKLLVFSHGHGETAKDFTDVIQRVASQDGVAVIAMDNRGPVGGWNIGAGADDTIAAVRWYRKRNRNITFTVSWGWSMGGLVSGTAVADAPKLFDVWVASFPATNLLQLWQFYDATHNTADASQIQADAGNCTPSQCMAAYVRRSPMLRPKAYRGLRRVILLHGIKDTTSPFFQSSDLAAGLRTAKVPTTFYRVDSSVHGRGPVANLAERIVDRVFDGHERLTGPRYVDKTLPEGKLPPR